jgi:hypothetical protein
MVYSEQLRRTWSSGYDCRLPSGRAGFDSPCTHQDSNPGVAQLFCKSFAQSGDVSFLRCKMDSGRERSLNSVCESWVHLELLTLRDFYLR